MRVVELTNSSYFHFMIERLPPLKERFPGSKFVYKNKYLLPLLFEPFFLPNNPEAQLKAIEQKKIALRQFLKKTCDELLIMLQELKKLIEEKRLSVDDGEQINCEDLNAKFAQVKSFINNNVDARSIMIRFREEEEDYSEIIKLFIGMIQHDLKTPLSWLKNSLDLAELIDGSDGQSQEKRRLKNQVAIKATLIAMDYIKQFLNYAQLELFLTQEIDNHQKTMGKVGLEAVIAEVVESAALKAESNGVAILFNSCANLPKIMGSVAHIRALFQNLIDNAIKYNRQQGSITIAGDEGIILVVPTDIIRGKIIISIETNFVGDKEQNMKDTSFAIRGYIRVKIEDTGVGIPEDLLEKIFNPGFRVSKDNGVHGSGLGLAIVLKILKLHKAEVTVISKVGEGSIFIVSFPMIKTSELSDYSAS